MYRNTFSNLDWSNPKVFDRNIEDLHMLVECWWSRFRSFLVRNLDLIKFLLYLSWRKHIGKKKKGFFFPIFDSPGSNFSLTNIWSKYLFFVQYRYRIFFIKFILSVVSYPGYPIYTHPVKNLWCTNLLFFYMLTKVFLYLSFTFN